MKYVLSLVIGTALALLAGCEKQYMSTTTIQLQVKSEGGTVTNGQEEAAEAALLAAKPADSRIAIERIQNTELFQITAKDADPKVAMNTANKTAEAMKKALAESHPDWKLIIWEYAEVMKK